MGFLAPILGVAASLIGGNIQNKQTAAAAQSAQNAANGANVDASRLAQAQNLFNFVQEMQNYQNLINANPNPANTWNKIQGPTPIQGSIGGGQIGSSGNPQQQMPQGMGGMPRFMPPQTSASQQMPQQFPTQNLTGMYQPSPSSIQPPPMQGQMTAPAASGTSGPIQINQPGIASTGTQGLPLRYLQAMMGSNMAAGGM